MKKLFLLTTFIAFCMIANAQNRWALQSDGGILWEVERGDIHKDHVEMSGQQVSVIETYGIDDKGMLISSKDIIFPMLRIIPNDTHGHTQYVFGDEAQPIIKINNYPIAAWERPVSFYFKGKLVATTAVKSNNIKVSANVVRELFPSVDKALVIEKFTIINSGENEITVYVEDFEKITRSQLDKSVYGVYELTAKSQGAGTYKVQPQASVSFAVLYSGRKVTDPLQPVYVEEELAKRTAFVNQMFNDMRFECPDPVLSRMFDFAKIRATESIYATKNGLVHGPGGGRYYAAIWANDQAEYANPLFGYMGYNTAVESAMTSWKWFAKYMNQEYKPIPSSIIAEGTDYWNGAGDRGDQAMIAYGAARFALALGDKQKAEELWPLIEWCLEFSKRKINKNGVVASDSDELEGRFPAGDANLCTSSLYYDALLSASYLGKELGKPKAKEYEKMAKTLRTNINKFFGAKVEGYDTYRYYEGNDVLRAWICIPLTVGIFDKAKGTIDALFSPRLWTDDGLLTAASDKTFWDRSTLYGLRGVFMAGAREQALAFFEKYSVRRLLGNHVPYAVEAWPEGNQRHLSAESALYCRVVSEGIFGFRPTGLKSFQITPQLPQAWNNMALKNLIAFGGKSIDINVTRDGQKLKVEIIANGKPVKTTIVSNGKMIDVKL